MSSPEFKPDTVEQPPSLLEMPNQEEAEAGFTLEKTLDATEAALGRAIPSVQRPVGFHPSEISGLINAEVVARHIDEVPFLWQLRDRAVTAPHYSLHDLAELDERVEAQLDGLRVAGDYGWRLTEKALEMKGRGEIFMAGVLALESSSPRRLRKVLKIAHEKRELQNALISAAGWVPFHIVEEKVKNWMTAESAALRRIGIGTYAVHRQDPGQPLLHLLYDKYPAVRARALKAAGEMGRVDLLPMVLSTLKDQKQVCRFQAGKAAALLGDRCAWLIDILRDLALRETPYQEQTLGLALRLLPPGEAMTWLRQLWQKPQSLRLAAIGAGALGDPSLAGVLIELMEIVSVARVAGEAFSLITGADLAYLDLNRDGPEHDPADEEYWSRVHETLHADDDLPWPAPELVANWWRANQDRFQPGQRYLYGLSVTPENLRKVLEQGKQRQRAAAALELALLQPGQPLFEVRARGNWQERRLGL